MNAIVMQKKPQIIAFSIERKIHHLWSLKLKLNNWIYLTTKSLESQS